MLKQFFNSSVGIWESHRSYYYSGPNPRIEDSVTVFEWKKQDDMYIVQWDNAKMNSKGQMRISIVDDFTLHRDQGYFTKEPTVSKVQSSSANYLRTITEYNNCQFDERIEFVNNDVRLRRTIAYKLNQDKSLGDIFLVGNYLEKRVWLPEKENVDLNVEDER